MKKLKLLFPALEWGLNYQKSDWQGDIIAGLTIAVMLIPQGMAYAMLAGLPPIMGLYSSIIPLVIYALFGTSRQLAVGPVAMISLIVASGIGTLAEPGSHQYITYAVTLAFLVGVIQLVMGLGRLGFLTNFLSHPVISGFTSAAALIIGFSQLKHLLGLDLPRSHHIYQTIVTSWERIQDAQIHTVLIGAGSIVILVFLRRWKPMAPGALIVVILTSFLVWMLRLDSAGVAIVGSVPAGFPSPVVPKLDIEALTILIPTALTISFVGFIESFSIAKKLAAEKRYEVRPNQELAALGLANIAGSLFQAYPVTGGFSRTAVNGQAGAKTGLASIITAIVICLTLLYLTPLLYYLPKATLAAIIMVAVFGLVDIKEVALLWQIKRSDLSMLGLTFAATIFFGIEQGIGVGVIASLLLFIVKSTQPHFAVLGKIPHTKAYRNILRHPDAIQLPGVLLLRMDAQFYYGNMTFLKEILSRLEKEQEIPLQAVVIDASSINNLDSSADKVLHEIRDEYSKRGIQLFFANVKGPVMDVMKKSGFYSTLGKDHFFLELHEAVEIITYNTTHKPAINREIQ